MPRRKPLFRAPASAFACALLIAAASACAPSLAKRAERMRILDRRPAGGCRSLGPVSGASGGTGGAVLDSDALQTDAKSQLRLQAAEKGATYLFVETPQLERNQAGQM